MIMNNLEKPRCKLPDICVTSHLIGKIVVTLNDAGMDSEKVNFINEVKREDINIDYQKIIEIGKSYVEFYE